MIATVEGDAILTVTIATQAPIELRDLMDGLSAIEKQCHRYFEHNYPERSEEESRLLVRDVRSGSIIFDLAPAIAPFIADMENIKTIVEYVEAFRSKVLPWLTPNGRNPEATSVELQGFHDAVSAIAKDANGSIDLKARFIKKNSSGEEIKSEFALSTADARMIQGNIIAEQSERKLPSQSRFEQVVMSLHQASLDKAKPGKATGEKGVIETISDRPLKLVYASEMAGQRIKDELRQDANPLKKAFIVDVNVELFNGNPHAYRITNVHSVDAVD